MIGNRTCGRIAGWALATSVAALPIAAGIGQSTPGSESRVFARADNQAGGACKGLYGDHGTVPEAPTSVTLTEQVAPAGKLPGYCHVQGIIGTSVKFDLKLPERWNGKFLEYGGYNGVVPATCDDPLARGYACLTTNQGAASGAELVWAWNNLDAEIDFGMRSQHVGAVAGKTLVAQFYGRPPERSYMNGCSQGGRQGMMSAQRYPTDFDGIIAGAPGRGDLMAVFWAVQALSRPDGRPLVNAADLALVNRRVVAQCDKNDGLVDGVIGDPRRCGFDPAELVCRPGQTAECLTKAQADGIRKVYTGAVTATDLRIEPGGSAMKGSELNWIGSLIDGPDRPGVYTEVATAMMRYVNFHPDLGPTWQPKDFDWDRDPQRMGTARAINVPTNPDLRFFKARGGKLIAFKGWQDELMPEAVTDYYETAERTMGGRAATQSFYRLFMMPGVDHCGGGPGADTVDWLTALEDWSERGRAPDVLIASKLKARLRYPVWPIPAADVVLQRPLFPYPLAARYRGGPADRASSFAAAQPR